MHFVLLILDEKLRVGESITQEISKYVRAFFNTELRIVEIPKTVVAPKGWNALRERTVLPLHGRPGRPDGPEEGQICAPELLTCLRKLKQTSASIHGVEVDHAEFILGLTGMEFYSDTTGTLPGEPVPKELTKRAAVFSEKDKVGACSLAKLADPHASETGRRKCMRQALTLVTHSILTLLGLRTCQSKTCLAYLRPFSPEDDGLKGTSFLLCAQCEHDLIRKIQPNIEFDMSRTTAQLSPFKLRTPLVNVGLSYSISADESQHNIFIHTLAQRYRELARRLGILNRKLERLQRAGRNYSEFENEYEWLCKAEQILLRIAGERKTWVDKEDRLHVRRRCLLHCIKQVHKEQEQRPLQRSCSDPMLRRRCLVDMTVSLPYSVTGGFFSSVCLDKT